MCCSIVLVALERKSIAVVSSVGSLCIDKRGYVVGEHCPAVAATVCAMGAEAGWPSNGRASGPLLAMSDASQRCRRDAASVLSRGTGPGGGEDGATVTVVLGSCAINADQFRSLYISVLNVLIQHEFVSLAQQSCER